MFDVLTRMPLLKPQWMEVTTEGELVVIDISGTKLKMHYKDALTISQWIRIRAKEAKSSVGDTSRNWRAVINLDGLLPDGTKVN